MACFAKGARAKTYDPDHTLVGGTSILWGFQGGHIDKLLRCFQNGYPFFHLDHSYFKRGYRNPSEEGNFRVNFRHFHQTRVIPDLPADRAGMWRNRVGGWKTDGKVVVIVEPSPNITRVLGTLSGHHVHPKDWCRSVEEKVKRFTDRPVYRKEKGGGFEGVLRNAWAVISISSVAEVEAAVYGVPVFVGEDSPARCVGLSLDELDKIETPTYPDREDWLRTISYSQFSGEEMQTGKAWGILRELYGDHHIRGTPDGAPELDAP